MSRSKIIAGNWKMNGTPADTERIINSLITGVDSAENTVPIICPPYTSLSLASELLLNSPVKLGAQNLSEHEQGAYTGEISADMLIALGVKYVIIGHSERRQLYHECNNLINAKIKKAIEKELLPILCIGETLQQRDSGKTEDIVSSQLKYCTEGLCERELKKLIIAYEPIWAIGTGKTATPEMAQDVHNFIRKKLSTIEPAIADLVPILYGGSVKPDNAAGLLEQPDIDGALVGGASLKADSFIKIIEAA